jgi:type III restriction enzyme
MATTIQKTPGVCGGNACVRDTRIPVWTLQRLRELGRTDRELLDDYPTLTPADIEAGLGLRESACGGDR